MDGLNGALLYQLPVFLVALAAVAVSVPVLWAGAIFRPAARARTVR